MNGWRWDRLHDALTRQGIDAPVDMRSSGNRHITSITLRMKAPGHHLNVRDQFRGNQWVGWTLYETDSEGFGTTLVRLTKNADLAASAVVEALTRPSFVTRRTRKVTS